MTRLVLLNGAPGSGKSTLARLLVAQRPMALALDVDVVRSMLGGWAASPGEAGLAARALALAMARAHLAAGHDVVVPQLLARVDFIEQLEQLAAQLCVTFVEVFLDVDMPTALRRFAERSAQGLRGEHRDAAALVERAGGPAELVAVHARLEALVAQRPGVHRVVSLDGDIEGTLRAVTAVVDAAPQIRP